MSYNFKLVTNNVKGLGNMKKRQNIFKRLKDLVKGKGIIFIQETHSCKETEIHWKKDFGTENEIYFNSANSSSKGVAIGFCGNLNHSVNKVYSDEIGKILIIEIKINNEIFILINIYNENCEKDQVNLLKILENQLNMFENANSSNIILAGDFNFYFDKTLEAYGGNPQTKKQSIASFLKIKGKWDLTDIWRIRNPTRKKYTFRQNHFSGYLQRRLDYIFVTNQLQNHIKSVDIEISISSDHSPVSMDVKKTDPSIKKGPGFWKFNSSLLEDRVFVSNMEKVIEDTKTQHSGINKQANWEIIKYKIKQYSIKYSKGIAKEKKKIQTDLENRIKQIENSGNYSENAEYIQMKKDLEGIYDKITEGARIRSKCRDYEFGEKSNKYFLNLEKKKQNPHP